MEHRCGAPSPENHMGVMPTTKIARWRCIPAATDFLIEVREQGAINKAQWMQMWKHTETPGLAGIAELMVGGLKPGMAYEARVSYCSTQRLMSVPSYWSAPFVNGMAAGYGQMSYVVFIS